MTGRNGIWAVDSVGIDICSDVPTMAFEEVPCTSVRQYNVSYKDRATPAFTLRLSSM